MDTLPKTTKINRTSKKKPQALLTTGSLKFSVRINTHSGSFVTSISLKKNVCSLWLLLREYNDFKNPKDMILDFIHNSLDIWKEDTAKGFSDFITERMIKDILSKKDFIEYKRIHDKI